MSRKSFLDSWQGQLSQQFLRPTLVTRNASGARGIAGSAEKMDAGKKSGSPKSGNENLCHGMKYEKEIAGRRLTNS
jgi:hypothetical protein